MKNYVIQKNLNQKKNLFPYKKNQINNIKNNKNHSFQYLNKCINLQVKKKC